LEEDFHRALHRGDFARITQLVPRVERLESQLLEILEDPRRSDREKDGLRLLPEIVAGLRRDAARLVAQRSWRLRAQPRIEQSPDPRLISVSPEEDGHAVIAGAPGAAADPRARIVRVVNLFTSDQAAALVREDGSFEVRLVAPPGSSIQISTSMQEDLPEELRRGLASQWGLELTNLREEFHGMIQGDRTCSPALIFPVSKNPVAQNKACFVRKLGKERWLFGTARLARTHLNPGDVGEAAIILSIRCESERAAHGVAGQHLDAHCGLAPLFDNNGAHLSAMRLSATHVLTPTGLPIETQTDLVGRRDHHGRFHMEPGPQGVETHVREVDFGRWSVQGRVAKVSLNLRFEIPHNTPPGTYSLGGHIQPREVDEFFGLEHPGELFLGRVTIGNPSEPRLACVLLGSAGSGGSRGAVAREDRNAYNFAPRNVLRPDKLIVPRDDARTNIPIRYPLDPYLPLVSLTDRPHEFRLWPPRISFDCESSSLTVTVEAPDGKTERIGPAPLIAAQNDLTSVCPDRLVRDRIVAPVGTSFGNPSLADIYHLSGRGAFDYTFTQYGHHVISLNGKIEDSSGARHTISGTYDVYVARPIDIDIFPEPGTPLWPGAKIYPQVRVLPPVPADVTMDFLHVPGSDPAKAMTLRLAGKANRWGVFLPDPRKSSLLFENPGEYRCDVTVKYVDQEGVWWMASRRGASVVVTPNSDVVIHGERGNRAPSMKWRARWFVARNSHFITDTGEDAFDMGHTCYPYENGDVAWLGDRDPDSLFPNLTFEDPTGTIASLTAERWPAVRSGAGRAGLYPDGLRPEDRLAIGEMPFVSSSSKGLSPSMKPEAVDQWGYFYTTSWRPGVSVRSHVAEDMVPASYWFFDDVYGYQFGVGPNGDMPGDVKMNYGGTVFRDLSTGIRHYGAYASMLVLIDPETDPIGRRVMPPFGGLIPGSPPSGPLIEIGGKRYDMFLTYGALAPGVVLDVGDRFCVSGVVWPPISGVVRASVTSPSGKRTFFETPSNAVGLFNITGPIASEPGEWIITAEGLCNGKTSLGTIADLVPEEKWPRGGGIGLEKTSFVVPVVPRQSESIAFDLPQGKHLSPPRPLVIQGYVPIDIGAQHVKVLVSLPGQVIDTRELPVDKGCFAYVYDPQVVSKEFPNVDVTLPSPDPIQCQPAWYDTVTFTFWAGDGAAIRAGTVLLQGEDVYASTSTGRPPPQHTAKEILERPQRDPFSARKRVHPSAVKTAANLHVPHSSPLALSSSGRVLFAAHRWSGEVARISLSGSVARVSAIATTGREVRSVALSEDESLLYAALSDSSEILTLDAADCREISRLSISGEPWAVLPSPDANSLFVADFDGNRVLRINARNGKVQNTSPKISRPSCLTYAPERDSIYTVDFRAGKITQLDLQCRLLRRIPAPDQLNQCRSLTFGPDGMLYAPQTRSDTAVGGRTFDRSVFPVVAAVGPTAEQVSLDFFPDLWVVPPHRPREVAVDTDTLYLASAGSNDVLAIDLESRFPKWHSRDVGQEPDGIALDTSRGLLYVLTLTGQEIVTLSARTGEIRSRLRFAHDPTPSQIARGRYLFGNATDPRLTKDQWMSCAVCHPDGDVDGRQWDFGEGPLDTHTLRGALRSSPLHYSAHLDEIQDTYDFTRHTMAGHWFVQKNEMNNYLGVSNAGYSKDLDALAAYIESLAPKRPPNPPSGTLAAIEKGWEIFFSEKAGCVACHPPPLYTDSGQKDVRGDFIRHNVGTYREGGGEALQLLDTPSLLGLRQSEPYLHDGRAPTLESVFTHHNQEDLHGHTSHLSENDIHCLSEFIRYLDPGPSTDGSESVFTVSPANIESISSIVLLGNLNPPGHVFPTDHIYLYISNSDGDDRPDVVTLYSPGDLTVTAIEASEHVTAGFPDYSITLRTCEDITVVLGHVSSLSTEIFGDTSAFDRWTLVNEHSTGGETYRSWRKICAIQVTAGEILGTVGGNPRQYALDLGVYDRRHTHDHVANPNRWLKTRYLHAVCPLSLYEAGPVRNRLLDLVHQDKVEGDSSTRSGTLQDLPGTAQGCWFLSGISDTYPEDPHLALVRSNVHPARAVLSVGNSIPDLDSAAYEFLPETSGLLNRDFGDIIPNGQIYGFQIGHYAGIIVVQMSDAETLWIEALRDATADPTLVRRGHTLDDNAIEGTRE
jgi:DNA-binding beta-propeller fold protein YncE